MSLGYSRKQAYSICLHLVQQLFTTAKSLKAAQKKTGLYMLCTSFRHR